MTKKKKEKERKNGKGWGEYPSRARMRVGAISSWWIKTFYYHSLCTVYYRRETIRPFELKIGEYLLGDSFTERERERERYFFFISSRNWDRSRKPSRSDVSFLCDNRPATFACSSTRNKDIWTSVRSHTRTCNDGYGYFSAWNRANTWDSNEANDPGSSPCSRMFSACSSASPTWSDLKKKKKQRSVNLRPKWFTSYNE